MRMDVRLVAKEPLPLPVNRVVHGCIEVEGATLVVCIEAAEFVLICPVRVSVAGAD